MTTQTWDKMVPDSATPMTGIPIEWHQYIQENIPVHKKVVETAEDGVTVTLPSAFASIISDVSEYAVQCQRQSSSVSGGDVYPTEKTTTDFKIENSGSAYGEPVLVMVYWMKS